MKAHQLKTWPQYFEEIFTGKKSFEVRINDRDFKIGDRLDFMEWNPEQEIYTGRHCHREISYILKSPNPFIELRNNVIISFAQFESSEKEEFHVWIIPERKEILLEDRGGGIPVGATEHIVFDIWDGALKLCHFLEKTIGYTLEIDNEAGRWQSLN